MDRIWTQVIWAWQPVWRRHLAIQLQRLVGKRDVSFGFSLWSKYLSIYLARLALMPTEGSTEGQSSSTNCRYRPFIIMIVSLGNLSWNLTRINPAWGSRLAHLRPVVLVGEAQVNQILLHVLKPELRGLKLSRPGRELELELRNLKRKRIRRLNIF